ILDCAVRRPRPAGFRSAGFQTCCVADFQVGGRPQSCDLRVWKPAIQQTWKSALPGCGFAALCLGVFVVQLLSLKSSAGRSLPFGVIVSAREKTVQTNRPWFVHFGAVAGRGRDYFSATVFVRGQRTGEG